MPIGGKYRLIDVPISGCLHAGIRRIFVLTQFNSASLNRHISNTYQLDRFSGGFVEILAAEQTPDSSSWFQGTADAVRQAARHFARYEADYRLHLDRLLRDARLAAGDAERIRTGIAELDRVFHCGIVRATQNAVLLRLVNVFYLMTERRRAVYFGSIGESAAACRPRRWRKPLSGGPTSMPAGPPTDR